MTVDTILQAASECFEIPITDIAQADPDSRKACKARQVVIYLAWLHARLPLPDVASKLGITTAAVEHGCLNARRKHSSSAEFRSAVSFVETVAHGKDRHKVAALSLVLADGKVTHVELTHQQLVSARAFLESLGLEVAA